MSSTPFLTLGIETSCDETSVAVLSGGDILANDIFTQGVHSVFGGVVPELASRAHIVKIDGLAQSVLKKIDLSPGRINLIAVTDSPGLAGALLVGISFALGLHCGYGIPLTGINHLEGHICSLFLENRDIAFPFLALVASGGHTAIYRVDDFGRYECLGQTVDDAAGEAFDKIGKILGFPYPAGRAIEQQAALAASRPPISFPIARPSSSPLDFSFSGLKTAVKYLCAEKGADWIEKNRALVCFSFQKTIVDSLAKNLLAASEMTGIRTVAAAGGVACNGELRRTIQRLFPEKAFFPSPELCTDNAAMIARAGYERSVRSMLRFPRMNPSAGL